jgi:hypothetical protein
MGGLVWLASYPKSGNTWIRAFLHNYLKPGDRPYDIDRLTDLTTGESGGHLYRRHDPRPPGAYTLDDVQRMRPLVHRDLTRLAPGPVFVKTHNAVRLVRGVPLLTPSVTAGALYVLRDPRDVALSYARHLGRPVDWVIDFMAEPGASAGADGDKVYELLASWSIHVASWTERPNPLLHVMRYEDMVAEPERAFGAMLRFLGLEPAAERLARAVRFSAFAELQAQERAKGFVERLPGAAAFFHTGRAGAWHDLLSAGQAARIERDHRVQMTRFGYLEGPVPSGVRPP